MQNTHIHGAIVLNPAILILWNHTIGGNRYVSSLPKHQPSFKMVFNVLLTKVKLTVYFLRASKYYI